MVVIVIHQQMMHPTEAHWAALSTEPDSVSHGTGASEAMVLGRIAFVRRIISRLV